MDLQNIRFGDASSCGSESGDASNGYVYKLDDKDKRRRLAYHADGDENHSVASNARLAAHNANINANANLQIPSPPPLPPSGGGGRVLVFNEADQRMDELFPDDDEDGDRDAAALARPEDRIIRLIRQVHYHPDNAAFRDEFIRKLHADVLELLTEDNVRRLLLMAANTRDSAALQEMHSKIVYINVGCNYCLIFAESDAYLRGRFTSQLRAASNIIIRLEEIINTSHDIARIMDSSLQQDGPAVVLHADSYHYANLTKSTAKQTLLESQVVEALVYKALELGKYALLFDTSDGGSGSDYRMCDSKFEIFVLQRAFYYDGSAAKQHRTHFYGKLFKFDRFVHFVMQDTIVGRQVSLAAIETFIKRNMGAPDNLLRFAPRVMYNRNLMAFANGVYVLDEDCFYANDDELPESQGTVCECVPRIFHAVDIPYDQYAHVRVEQQDFADETRTAAILSAIPTPALDRIIQGQQWPASVQLIVLALLGRLLHSLHSRQEKLHMLIYLHGLAGTGKSTLCLLGGRMLASCRTRTVGSQCVIDTSEAQVASMAGQMKLAKTKKLHVRDGEPRIAGAGAGDASRAKNAKTESKMLQDRFSIEIESRVEENFPMQGIIGKLSWSISEVQPGMNFPRALMLKMASSDFVTVTRKNQVPVEMVCTAPGWMAGNPKFPYNDTQGEVERRAVILEFLHVVSERDQQLGHDLDREIANIIMKCNRVYLAWAEYAADKDVYPGGRKKGALPSYFERTRDEMMSQLSKAVLFFNTYIEEGLMVYRAGDRTLRCTLPLLFKHYRQFLQTQHLMPSLGASPAAGPGPGPAQQPQSAAAPGPTILPGSLKNDLISLLKRRHIVSEGEVLFGIQLVDPAVAASASAAAAQKK